jgi:hypothetical protein
LLKSFYDAKTLYEVLEYLFLALAMLLFVGLLIQCYKMVVIEHWWLFFIIEILFTAIVLFVRLKVLEKRINRIWGKYNLYGEI